MSNQFAAAGSQRWLQIAVDRAPDLLDEALRRSGAIDRQDSVTWASPVAKHKFRELRDGAALRALAVPNLPNRTLSDFWPRRGPVWDALGCSEAGRLILLEAKAHIPEAVSPPSQASKSSLKLIQKSLTEARRYYAPKSKANWSGVFYQYANRLAFHYLLRHLNALPSVLVFLDFCNATDVEGPESAAEWRGATRVIHAQLGLPADLTEFGVFHAYLDIRELVGLVKSP